MNSFQRFFLCPALLSLCLGFAALPARAQFIQSDAGPHDYNTQSNWAGSVINGQFTQTLTQNQTITFAAATTLSNGLQFNLGGTNTLTLQSSGASGQSVSLTDHIALGGTADVVIGSHTANHELSIDLGLAPRNVSVAAGRTLSVLNGVTGSTGGSIQKYGAGTLVVAGVLGYPDMTTVWEGSLQFGDGTTNGSLLSDLVVKSGANVNFYTASGTSIVGSQISGAGSVTKDANGILKLTADNTYSGETAIHAGTMIVANSSGSGTGSGAIQIGSAGRLQIGDGATLNGSVAGNIVNEGELVIKRPGNSTLGPKISGSGSVIIDAGAGSELTLGSANDNNGVVRLLSGSLYDGASGAYSPNATFTLGSNASIFVAHPETIARLIDLTPGTAGTVSIGSGAQLTIRTAETDTFTGTITGAGGLKIGATGTQILAGVNDYTGGTTVETGTLTAMNMSGSATGTGAVTVNPGAFLNIGQTSSPGRGAVAGSIVNNGTLQIDRPDIFTFASSISGTGAVRFGYGSTRIVTLAGTNTYSGNTVITEGHVADGAPGAFSSLSTFAVDAGAYLDVNFNQTIAGLSAGQSGSGRVTMANGATLTVNSAATQAFNGAITGAGSIVKAGTGSLALSGTSTYTGSTSINGGSLVVTSDDNLGNPSSPLLLGGGTLEFAAGAAIYRDASIGVAGGTLNPRANDVYLHGRVSGSGALTKIGAGTVWLKGDNTYTAGTAVLAGTLVLANSSGSGTGSGAVSVEPGATLQVGSASFPNWGSLTGNIANAGTVSFKRADATSYGGSISGPGAVQVNTSSSFALSGSNTFSGDTLVQAGILQDGAAGAFSSGSRMRISVDGTLKVNHDETIAGLADGTGAGNVSIAGTAGLTIASTGTDAFSGTISGGGSLTKSGAGTLYLDGTSSYTGGTTINAGTLKVASNSSLGDATGALTFNGGTLQLAGGFTSTRPISLLGSGGTIDTNTFEGTLSGPISGSGGLTHQGTGVLTLAGANTYTGGTTVRGGGVLDFTADSNLGPTGSTVTLDGGFLRTRAGIADFTHPISLQSGGTINIYGLDSNFSRAISGSGSLTVMSQGGGGMLTLSGTSTYTGATDVQSGTLKIATDNALPTTTFLSLASGAALEVAANQFIAGLADAVSGSMIRIESGKTFAVTLGSAAGNSVFGGVLSGEGEFKVGPTDGAAVVLTGDNGLFTGHTTIDTNGVLQLGAGGSAGMGPGYITNNGTLTFYRLGTVAPAGVISGNGRVNIGLSAESGPVGAVSFASGHTYSGGTNVYAGRLLATNSTGSATGSGAVNVYSGAVFGGNGTISGALKVESGGIVSPGISSTTPGTLSVGATTFGNSGQFDFAIKKAEGGILGSDLSLLSISGALTITADANCRFVVNLYSATDSGAGLLADFDPAGTYSWMFASATGGVSGFAANAFQVNTANFQNSFAGDFSVGNIGDNLFVNYTPVVVPEPSTWALLTMGLSLVGWVARRRRN